MGFDAKEAADGSRGPQSGQDGNGIDRASREASPRSQIAHPSAPQVQPCSAGDGTGADNENAMTSQQQLSNLAKIPTPKPCPAPPIHSGLGSSPCIHVSGTQPPLPTSLALHGFPSGRKNVTTKLTPEILQNRKLRAGKWIAQEEEYAELLIELFEKGQVTDCDNGCTLRSYLSQKLHCAPMRISKKFAGKGIGKMVYMSKVNGMRQNSDELKKNEKRVKEAEQKFCQAIFPPEEYIQPPFRHVFGSPAGVPILPGLLPLVPSHHVAFAVPHFAPNPMMPSGCTTPMLTAQSQSIISHPLAQTACTVMTHVNKANEHVSHLHQLHFDAPRQQPPAGQAVPAAATPGQLSSANTLKTVAADCSGTSSSPRTNTTSVLTAMASKGQTVSSTASGQGTMPSLTVDQKQITEASVPSHAAALPVGTSHSVPVTAPDKAQKAPAPDSSHASSLQILNQIPPAMHDHQPNPSNSLNGLPLAGASIIPSSTVQAASTTSQLPVAGSVQLAGFQPQQAAGVVPQLCPRKSWLSQGRAAAALEPGAPTCAPSGVCHLGPPTNGQNVMQRTTTELPDFLSGFDKVALIGNSVQDSQFKASSTLPNDTIHTAQEASPAFTSRSFDDFQRFLAMSAPLENGRPASEPADGAGLSSSTTNLSASGNSSKAPDTMALFTAESYAMFAQESAIAASQHAAYMPQRQGADVPANCDRNGCFDIEGMVKLVSEHVGGQQKHTTSTDRGPSQDSASITRPRALRQSPLQSRGGSQGMTPLERLYGSTNPNVVSGSEPSSTETESATSFRMSASDSAGVDSMSNDSEGVSSSSQESEGSNSDTNSSDEPKPKRAKTWVQGPASRHARTRHSGNNIN